MCLQLIQRRCKVCNGSGLVARGRGQRKCPECGGFFPWISWKMFLSANARPGNGGGHLVLLLLLHACNAALRKEKNSLDLVACSMMCHMYHMCLAAVCRAATAATWADQRVLHCASTTISRGA
jgi:hypothetical protein